MRSLPVAGDARALSGALFIAGALVNGAVAATASLWNRPLLGFQRRGPFPPFFEHFIPVWTVDTENLVEPCSTFFFVYPVRSRHVLETQLSAVFAGQFPGVPICFRQRGVSL